MLGLPKFVWLKTSAEAHLSTQHFDSCFSKSVVAMPSIGVQTTVSGIKKKPKRNVGPLTREEAVQQMRKEHTKLIKRIVSGDCQHALATPNGRHFLILEVIKIEDWLKNHDSAFGFAMFMRGQRSVVFKGNCFLTNHWLGNSLAFSALPAPVPGQELGIPPAFQEPPPPPPQNM